MNTTPTKRHHSQISSMPQRPSSSSNTSSGRNPLENLMHMFGRRAARDHHSSNDSMQHHQARHPEETEEEEAILRRASSKQRVATTATEYDSALCGRCDDGVAARVRRGGQVDEGRSGASSSYVPPVVHSVGKSREQEITADAAATTSTKTEASLLPSASDWREASCPRTGKTYYWNVRTRESRWKKPLELASHEEREAIASKEREQRLFFEAMERNVMRRLDEARREREASLLAAGEDVSGLVGGACPSPMSTATSIATSSEGERIHKSWMDPAGTCSPTTEDGTGKGDDWIAGWITPNAQECHDQDEDRSPSDGSLPSLSSLGGLSALMAASSSSYSYSPISLGAREEDSLYSCGGASASSMSREERDDRVRPLGGGASRPGRVERIKSSSAGPVVDRPDLIRTISKMECDLLALRALNPGYGGSPRIAAPAGAGAVESPRAVGTRPSALRRDVSEYEPLTPTGITCDILSSLHLDQGGAPDECHGVSLLADGFCGALSGLPAIGARGGEVSPGSPLTPASPEEEEEEEGSEEVEIAVDVDGDLALASPVGDQEEEDEEGGGVAETEAEADGGDASTTAATGGGARASPSGDVAKPSLAKRNTCGTIYLGSTLSAPDKDALIKCVCGVYRAHLLQSELRGVGGRSRPGHASHPDHRSCHGRYDDHAIFDDRRPPGDYRHLDSASMPSLSAITDFYRSIFLRSQMEVDCIIISLIYIERLIKRTGGMLSPSPRNWRSVLYSCMVLASKVWDDLSMWNCDFSRIGPSGFAFTLSRTNELEIALLRALGYKVKVNASEYAKYYFLLRGMLCRSGLANDDFARLRPLDARGAGAMNLETTAFAGGDASGATPAAFVEKLSLKERSKSYGGVDKGRRKVLQGSSRDDSCAGGPSPLGSPASKRLSLEQIVRM